jgi:HSP20 family protein
MSSITFRPFTQRVKPVAFNNEVKHILNHLWSQTAPGLRHFAQQNAQPSVNILKGDNAYFLNFNVAGYKKEQISILLEGDKLIVKATVDENQEAKPMNHQEFSVKNFERVFMLSEDIDLQNIQAKQENGILRITLTLREKAIPVKKEITVL